MQLSQSRSRPFFCALRRLHFILPPRHNIAAPFMSHRDPPPPPPPLPPQLWNLIRQRDATREAAVKFCQSRGERVTRDLLPTAPPPVAACGEVRMTRDERMRALGCMGRAMVMQELARGAGLPGALIDADAQKAWAAMMKREAAACAAASALFPFSAQHKAPDVVISNNRLSVTRASDDAWAWARSERGVAAGCGIVKWAVQLGKESGGEGFKLGVASDTFRGFAEMQPKQSWFVQDSSICADGELLGHWFHPPPPFAGGDVVTVELQRAPAVDGVLRVRVAG